MSATLAPAPVDAGAEQEPARLPGHTPAWQRWGTRAAAVVFSIVLFNACLWLYTRHNDFTYRYHADEQTKADQIESYRAYRNFNHPLLLLEATELAVRRFDVEMETQPIVETGRWVSAVFGAAAAVMLAWIGYASAGLAGMLLVGAAVGLCPPLLLYSHYMKEDVALVFGLALTLLASRAAWDAHRWWLRLPALVLLGAGAGVAASGKYVGVTALGLAVPVAIGLPRMRWYWRLVTPVLVIWCAVGSFLLINHRILEDQQRFDHFIHGYEREADHATSHHDGLALSRPNTWFASLLTVETMLHARVLAGVLGVCAMGTAIWRRKRIWDLVAIAFAGFYLVVLSYSVIPFHRYFLPVAVMVYLFAGLGAASLLNLFGRRGWLRLLAAGVGLAVIIGLQWPRCADYLGQLADDGRARLRQWAGENLPRGAWVIAEAYAGLTGPGDHRPGQSFPQPSGVRIQQVKAGPDAGGLDQLVRRGVGYVVIADTRYARYFTPVEITRGDPSAIERYRQWYRDLDAHHELVWENQPAHPTHSFTNPTIKVYRLKK